MAPPIPIGRSRGGSEEEDRFCDNCSGDEGRKIEMIHSAAAGRKGSIVGKIRRRASWKARAGRFRLTPPHGAVNLMVPKRKTFIRGVAQPG